MSHICESYLYNTGRTGSFIDNLDKGGELTSFEAEKMLKIVRHMATKRTQLNPNRLGSLWVSQIFFLKVELTNFIRIVQTQAILFLKSMSERVGYDIERHRN